MKNATLGIILGNRDFFPDHLVKDARKEIIELLQDMKINSVILSENDTKFGGVETYRDAQKCSDLFKKHSDQIDGILVALPNFGDEKGIADTLKMAGLNVPVLVQAYPDELSAMDPSRRRDAFCGKISVCNNLTQAGIPFTLTEKHVVSPRDHSFDHDLKKFLAICRVVNGLRSTRIGAIGARPGAFNTVRYSEKILEANGISVTTVDLSEILSHIKKLDANDSLVKSSVEKIRQYADSAAVPAEKLVSMGKLDVALSEFIEANDLNATAIQCWTSVQENLGINVCTVMSMMSDKLIPSACEVDVTGVLSMYALQLASGSPSALADWNNNYGDEDDKCVLFHCGNWAKTLVPNLKISTAPILGTSVGDENTYGAMEGQIRKNPLTFARLSTDDVNGVINGYVGEGKFTNDKLNTIGNSAVAQIPHLPDLMHFICDYGFEHHVAINLSHTADVLMEAFEGYLGWEMYHHENHAH